AVNRRQDALRRESARLQLPLALLRCDESLEAEEVFCATWSGGCFGRAHASETTASALAGSGDRSATSGSSTTRAPSPYRSASRVCPAARTRRANGRSSLTPR